MKNGTHIRLALVLLLPSKKIGTLEEVVVQAEIVEVCHIAQFSRDGTRQLVSLQLELLQRGQVAQLGRDDA